MVKEMLKQEIVVSGLSGRFPESENVEEFRQNLFAGVDMVTEDDRRWKPGIHGLPSRNGKLKEIDKFDAEYFGIKSVEVERMDPQVRILLEVAYEAIVDAGVDPRSIRGSNTGVFVGTSNAEAFSIWSTDKDPASDHVITGCQLSMGANQISFHFNLKGPSHTVDAGCSAGLLALHHAMVAIRTGQCDSAIVASSNLLLKPNTSVPYNKINMLSPDGTCRSFDTGATGYVRSEAMVAVYVQRSEHAHRAYASLVHAGNNSDGHKQGAITFPSKGVQKQLLQRVYQECGVDPGHVSYVETHGTGSRVGDPQELAAIDDVFCNYSRKQTLLIGSTKSNMGHPEPTAGLVSLAKVLLAIQEKRIPKNLHYYMPNPEIPALYQGHLQVVDEHTPLTGEYIGISSFGFGGTNVHLVVKFDNEEKMIEHSSADELRLFTYSARTQEGLDNALAQMKENGSDVGMQALLQATANTPIKEHPFRGYALLNHEDDLCKLKRVRSSHRKIWFIFAGLGSQWPGMGKDLMQIDTFRKSIEKCAKALAPYDMDLVKMIEESTEETFDSAINLFVMMAAIQIALTDLLHSIGIKPDGIIGHAFGEAAASYADGGLTAEQTIQFAYWKGRCIMEAGIEEGAMAAVGLSWDEALDRCPDDITPACYNAEDNITVSGPAESVRQFVEELQEEDIFVKEVASAGMPFHSHLIHKAVPRMREELSKIIRESKPRSERWISSSIPECDWDEDLAQDCSVDYHVNNVTSPVLFYDALQYVPLNAITIEIGPHGLMQTILKRTLSPKCVFATLMKKHAPGPEYLLSSLGQLYMAGMNIETMNLYPPVQFPVAVSTPIVSPFVQWDHSQSWPIPEKSTASDDPEGKQSCTYVVDTSRTGPYNYLLDHRLDGCIVFPAAGYIEFAWRAFAEINNIPFDALPVVIENAELHEATVLSEDTKLSFHVSVAPGNGSFEVLREDGIHVASGKISELKSQLPLLEESPKHKQSRGGEDADQWSLPLDAKDVYTELRLAGFDFGPEFQNIVSVNCTGTNGTLKWTDRWITFLSSMTQIGILSKSGFHVPTRIQSVKIHPQQHLQAVWNPASVPFVNDRIMNKVVSGGIELIGIQTTAVLKRELSNQPVLQSYKFVPYNQNVRVENSESYLDECMMCVKKGVENLLAKDDQTKNNDLLKYIQLLTESQQDKQQTPSKVDQPTSKNVANVEFQDGDNTYLKFLKQLFQRPETDFNEHLSALLASHQGITTHDRILGCLKRPQILKSSLHTVLENRNVEGNIGEGKVKIVEYGEGHFYKQMLPWIHEQPLLDPNYVVIRNENDMTEELTNLVCDGSIKLCKNWRIGEAIPDEIKSADLIILDPVVFDDRLSNYISALSKCVKDGGFFLMHGATANQNVALIAHALKTSKPFNQSQVRLLNNSNVIQTVINDSSLKIVSHSTTEVLDSLFLWRKLESNQTQRNYTDIYVSVSTPALWAPKMNDISTSDAVTWIASSSKHDGTVGMVKATRKMEGGSKARAICMEEQKPSDEELNRQKGLDLAFNVYRNGTWGHYVSLPIPEKHVTPTNLAHLDVARRGDLSSVEWVESPLKHFHSSAVHPQVEFCTVHYAALHSRDLALVKDKDHRDSMCLGPTPEDCQLGMEFSGTDSSGHRVMGFVYGNALATCVAAQKKHLWSVPAHWSLEQAATVPVVYCAAYYAIVFRGSIKRGDTVLIHSGWSGLGQAAITIALHYGCTVYTTVSSNKNVEKLIARFPQLSSGNIADSRDTLFEKHVMKQTKGRGCDVILNSLNGAKTQASLRCIAKNGRFLELENQNFANNTAFGMALLLKNVSVHGIVLDTLFQSKSKIWDKVSTLLQQGIQEGVVKPLSATVFGREDIKKAFACLEEGKEVGKVLVQIQEKENGEPIEVQAIPKVYCHPNKCYVILGGLGEFGLQLTQWLMDRGARNVLLSSNSGVTTGLQSRRLRLWNSRSGVKVAVSQNDATSAELAEQLMTEAQGMAPVGGVFNLAVEMDEQTAGSLARVFEPALYFQQVVRPKALATLYLDVATRAHCRDSLDWFVSFSSLASSLGKARRRTYGFADSYMESICESRRRDGLPGLAIQWGAVEEIDMASCKQAVSDDIIPGIIPQPITSCLTVLDKFLTQNEAIVASYVLAKSQHLATGSGNKITEILSSIATTLGLSDLSSIDYSLSLEALGLDSLMSVEIKHALEKALDTTLDMGEITTLSFSAISERLQKNSKTAPKEMSQPEAKPPSRSIVRMKSIQDDDVRLPLFMIHDISGTLNFLEPVAALVRGSVFGITATQDCPTTTLQDLAEYYTELIKTIQPMGPYRLCGYSFGATVALEMVKLLSVNDQMASLTLLEGSPDHFKVMTKVHIGNLDLGNVSEAETKLLCFFATYIAPGADTAKLGALLLYLPNLDARCQAWADYITRITSLKNSDELAKIIKMNYQRFLLIYKYQPHIGTPLDMSVTLVKAAQAFEEVRKMDEYWGLRQYFTGVVETQTLQGDHHTMLSMSAQRVADILNDNA